MNKKALILTVLLVVSFIAALIKMIVVGPFNWIPLAGAVICGAYGTKRSFDESIIGDIVLILSIFLMVCITFNIQL